MKFLSQKLNVVITAGASGIGRTIAMAYAREGCSVFVCDNAEEFIISFKTENPDIFIQKTDISIFSEVESFFNAVKRQASSVDVLINCAGIAGPTGNLQDVEPDEWDQTIAVNLSGMFYSLKSAIPLLKTSDQASIINIASSAAFWIPITEPIYGSKMGSNRFNKNTGHGTWG